MVHRLSQSVRDEAHFRVLHLLAKHPHYSQRDISAELGMSLGKVNYCLSALVDKGLVKIENFKASKHKLGYLHVLTPSGIAARSELMTGFLKRKLAEFEALSDEIAALQQDLEADTAPKCEDSHAIG